MTDAEIRTMYDDLLNRDEWEFWHVDEKPDWVHSRMKLHPGHGYSEVARWAWEEIARHLAKENGWDNNERLDARGGGDSVRQHPQIAWGRPNAS